MKLDVTFETPRDPLDAPSSVDLELGTKFVQSAARRLGLVSLTVAGGVVAGIVLNAIARNAFGWGSGPAATHVIGQGLLDGVDLESLVKEFGPLSPSRAVHLLAQACDSLAEAHAAGLVHRDVKPANLFCCRVGSRSDFLKVLDFGIVRLDREQRRDQVDLTHAGIVGTPAFMAPEQAACRDDIDGSVDLYALGAVGFWLLTGTYVFSAETTVAMLVELVRTPAVRPSERLGGPLPPDLDDLIHSCLAKNPLERPASVTALRRQLLACEVAPWSEEDARGWWKKHRPSPDSESSEASTLLAGVQCPREM